MRWSMTAIFLLILAFVPLSCELDAIRVGSKKFTESVILGEVATQLGKSTGKQVVHQQELGGTRLVFDALKNGDIDIYPEYTGTITHEIFAELNLKDRDALQKELRKHGILMTAPLGFGNSYEIGMREDVAEKLDIAKLSDLRRYPNLKLRFSSEYMERDDGWPNLKKFYDLPQEDVKGVDHDISYRQLDAKLADAIDTYSTDAKIKYYNLRVLEDDKEFFPEYESVLLYRADLQQRAPEVVKAIRRLEGNISRQDIIQMNEGPVLFGTSEMRTAADFLFKKFELKIEVREQTAAERIWKHTLEHLDLVRKSLIAAMLVAIPLGILAAKQRVTGHVILAVVGIIQTIPALALLVLLMGPVNFLGLSSIGSGSATAVIALFLYSLLPIVRNTYAGLQDIPTSLQESADALGLSPISKLRLIELPTASRTILAGIKTAAVINVGFATLGALIGAGGYGQPILTGIRLNDTNLILQGAVPAAVLALIVQGIFDLAEKGLVPKGLRLKTEQ